MTRDVKKSAGYERQALQGALARLDEVRWALLADRLKAYRGFLEMAREAPEQVAAGVGKLLDGHYGDGPGMLARSALEGLPNNRVTALLQLVGAFVWQAPEDMVAAARSELSPGERERLESAVQI